MTVIDDLPADVLRCCFDYASLVELLRYARVSSAWRRAAHSHPTFWRNVQLRHRHRDGGVELFITRLNSSSAFNISVTLFLSDPRAVQAVLDNIHRVSQLSLGRDELHILTSFLRPAPLLRTLSVSGGIFSATTWPVGAVLTTFLGGQTPKLDTVALHNCSFIYWQNGYAVMPTARNIRISMTENLKRPGFPPVGSPLTSPPPEVIFNSLAALFPNAHSLSLSIFAVRGRSEASGDVYPAAWQSAQLSPGTIQWLAQLTEFEAQGYATLTKYMQHISLAQKTTVSLSLEDRDAITYSRCAHAMHSCVPTGPIYAHTTFSKGSLALLLASADGALKRSIRTPMEDKLAHLSHHLSWFAQPASGRLVAWWMDSSWLSSPLDLLPPHLVFSELRVLVVEVVPGPFARAADPFNATLGAAARSRVECPSLRSVILVNRRDAAEGPPILPWTFFRRLADLLAVPRGAALELRGVLLPHDEPPVDARRPVFPFTKVTTAEIPGARDMGSDWFADLRGAATAAGAPP